MTTDVKYRTSLTEFYYGGDGFFADLGSVLQSQFVLTGVVNVNRNPVRGSVGLTADGVSAGYTATCGARDGVPVDVVAANPEGVLVVHRTDAGFAYAIPAIAVSVPTTSPASSAVTSLLAFAQTSDACAGEPATGAFVLPDGGIAFAVTPGTGIVPVAASGNAPAGGFVVFGVPLAAERSAP